MVPGSVCRLPAVCFLQGLRCRENVGQGVLGECGNLLFSFFVSFYIKLIYNAVLASGLQHMIWMCTHMLAVCSSSDFQVTARYWVWFPVLHSRSSLRISFMKRGVCVSIPNS